MHPTADSKDSWLRLERWFEVSERSAVLCRQSSYLESGKQRSRNGERDRKVIWIKDWELQRKYKHHLQPQDPVLQHHCPWLPSHSPEFGNKLETRKEGRRKRVKKYLFRSNSMRNFFGLIIVKKVPWNNNRGHWAAQAECARQSWLPSRDQVSLKVSGRKEGLFYGRKERDTHSLCSPSPFLIDILEQLQMPGQREGQKHACVLSSAGIILTWHLHTFTFLICPLTWSPFGIHTCSRLSLIHCTHNLAFFFFRKMRG